MGLNKDYCPRHCGASDNFTFWPSLWGSMSIFMGLNKDIVCRHCGASTKDSEMKNITFDLFCGVECPYFLWG